MRDFILILFAVFGGAAIGAYAYGVIVANEANKIINKYEARLDRAERNYQAMVTLDTKIMNSLRARIDTLQQRIVEAQQRNDVYIAKIDELNARLASRRGF